MIDRFPLEIILKVADYIDSNANKERPEYLFHYPSSLLRSLSQVNHHLQKLISPLLYSFYSLVRKFEYDGPISYQYKLAIKRLDLIAEVNKRHVHQLEIPSSMLVSEVRDHFKELRSLTILGDNDIEFDTSLILDHLALTLPKEVFQVHGLKRLDLLIDPRLIEDMTALNSFKECQGIEELNVTVRSLSTIIRFKPFLLFILFFKSLKKLSIKCTYQSQPSLLRYDPSDVYPTTYQFFQVLNKLELSHLSLDFLLLRLHPTFSKETHIGNRPLKPLHVSLIEQSLAGPSTTEQNDATLKFLSQLTSYSITTLKLVFGIQTELPYNSALHVLQNLCLEIHHGDEIFRSLRSIKNVEALMAWHIMDDTAHIALEVENGLLSYEVDGNFSPAYRLLEKYEVRVSPNSLLLIRKGQQLDHAFWSIECLSTLLLKFSKYKRSSLWD